MVILVALGSSLAAAEDENISNEERSHQAGLTHEIMVVAEELKDPSEADSSITGESRPIDLEFYASAGRPFLTNLGLGVGIRPVAWGRVSVGLGFADLSKPSLPTMGGGVDLFLVKGALTPMLGLHAAFAARGISYSDATEQRPRSVVGSLGPTSPVAADERAPAPISAEVPSTGNHRTYGYATMSFGLHWRPSWHYFGEAGLSLDLKANHTRPFINIGFHL